MPPVFASYLISRATGWGRFLLRWGTPLSLLHQFQRCEIFFSGGNPESEGDARRREAEMIERFRNESHG